MNVDVVLSTDERRKYILYFHVFGIITYFLKMLGLGTCVVTHNLSIYKIKFETCLADL